jgi:hypothetical protein
MAETRIVIHGETFLTLDAVAECYEIEVQWVERIYRLGLLGPGEDVEGHAAIASTMLERVAEILRLCRHHGVDPTLVELFLSER